MDVIAATDNKGLWENLHNIRQCEEKLLINSVCSSNEGNAGEPRSKHIEWVETSKMLADCRMLE